MYWSHQAGIDEDTLNHIVALYGDKPATSGEAFFVANYRIKALFYVTFMTLAETLTKLLDRLPNKNGKI